MHFRLTRTFQAAALCGALLGGTTIHAATMSNDEYKATKDRIEAEYKEQKASCDKLKDNAKDVCREEAKGKEKVSRAELEYNRTGDPKDSAKVAMAKADAAYEVAKERCDD